MKHTYLTACLVFSTAQSASLRPRIPQPDADGRYTLEAEGIKASFIPYGATLTNLFVKGAVGREDVLGSADAS